MKRIDTATKAADLFGAGKHGWKDGNLSIGVQATEGEASWFNLVQEEIANVIEAAGIALDANVRQQLAMAIQSGKLLSAAAAGTADAITATFTPGITELKDGMVLYVRAAAANATTTPTFTPADGTIAADDIVKGADTALVAGDIAGAGHWLVLQADLTLGKWVLLNPAKGISTSGPQYKTIQPVATPTLAGNAMTLPGVEFTLDFRKSALGSGGVDTVTGTPAPITIPAGATLGTVNGQQSSIVDIVINNGGVMERAVVNLAGGNDLSETGLISTTEISAAATAVNVFYSNVARVNVPYRIVGQYDSTQAVAGQWATAPTLVYGVGGQAVVKGASMVRVSAANGYGSTNTKIRRFTNVLKNQGSDITYADSATLGGSFTINKPGVYAISYTDNFANSADMAITLNTSTPSGIPQSSPASEQLALSTIASTNYSVMANWTGFLPAGSVVRAHTDGSAVGSKVSSFTIVRAG